MHFQHSAFYFYLPCIVLFFSKRNTHRIFLGNLFQKKILGTIYLHATSLLFFLFFFITVERDMERYLTSACATSYIHVQCSEDIYTSYNTIVRIYPAFFFCAYRAPSSAIIYYIDPILLSWQMQSGNCRWPRTLIHKKTDGLFAGTHDDGRSVYDI